MLGLKEVLIEQAKHLKKVSKFMDTQGDNLTTKQAHDIADIIKGNAQCLINLSKKV